MSRLCLFVMLVCLLQQPLSAGQFTIKPDVVYGHKDGMALTFDVVQPEEPNGASILFMVSGGFKSRWFPPEEVFRQDDPDMNAFEEFVDRGFTVFIVRHGSAPRYKVPDAVADVRRAVRFIRMKSKELNVDANRLGVLGGSAGGHLSLMLGTASDEGDPDARDPINRASNRVAAVVSHFPLVDMRKVVGPSKRFPALDFDPTLAESVSPIAHVTPDDAPTLLIHGDRDRLVSMENSTAIQKAFSEKSVDHELIIIEGADHGFRGDQKSRAEKATLAWFEQHLLPTKFKVQPTALNNGKTAFDRYIAAKDDTYSWKTVKKNETAAATSLVIDMKSQTWLRPDEVNQNVWQHWLTVVVPKGATSDNALLFIGGGSNGGNAPSDADRRMYQVAMATNSVCAELKMIPNQPLIFHDDGHPRKEDDLIAYTWDQYLKTGDERWPARFPMVKSVVRAMDTIESVTANDNEVTAPDIKKFVVAGGSKRGWTTWMTAAADRRVSAIAPIVIDVLNANVSMNHHYAAYGFWAPAIGDYVNHKITHRRNHPRYAELLQLVDPYAYRNRFTMPKCIITATGDQFFLPDSAQFYFDELPDEKCLCCVPNGEHSLDGTNAMDTLIAFHHAIVNETPRPQFSWKFPDDNTIRVSCKTKPKRVLLWSATNETARDFRVDTIGRSYESAELIVSGDGAYEATVETPPKGWSAFLVQLEFDTGAPTPMRLTTPVRVVPDVLPFADKEAPTIEQESDG